MECTTVDKATALGPVALLAKIDTKSAYRLVPVHQYDQPLLGFRWRGKVYLDAMLPFGLRSAPKVFNALADTLEWCFHYRGVNDGDHYLDDLVTMGPPASSTCARNLRVIYEVLATLGLPLAKDKCEGLSPRLTFLGIEIYTQERVLRLPQEELLRVQIILTQTEEETMVSEAGIGIVVGLLCYAGKVVAPGWSFLHRMIALLKGIRHRNHHIRLNKKFRADLQWSLTFMETWNGVSVLPPPHPSTLMHQAPLVPFVTINGFSCSGIHPVGTNISHLRNLFLLCWL